MINGINSYSNYNYTNALNNNTSNTKSSNITNDNLVSDKTGAINKILGYGVDKDGYFTSDFNEAADLPQDYKINSKMLINTLNLYTKTGFYKEIDLATSFKNAYENFKNTNFSQESMDKGKDLTRYFLAYRKDFLEGQSSLMGKILGFDKSISQDQLKDFQDFMNENRIVNDFLNPNNLINPNANLNSKELLSNGGMRFSTDEYKELMQEDWNFAFDGTSFEIALKSADEFYPELSSSISGINEDYKKLLQANISLQDFKNEYIKLKERFENFIQDIKNLHQEKLKNGSFEKIIQNSLDIWAKNEENLAFKAIQGESKNKETYKDNDTRNELVKKLLETKFSTSKELELLLGMKINNEDTESFNNFFSKKNLQNKSVDIRV